MLEVFIPAPASLPETHCIGAGTREQRLTRMLVPALWDHGIGVAGTSAAARDFAFVRWSPEFSQVLVTLAGQGEVWSEGRWSLLERGQAYVMPVGAFHAYRTAAGCPRWDLGWVVVPQNSPAPLPYLPTEARIVATDGTLFHAALTGLAAEAAGAADFAMLDSWARLLRGLTSRAASRAPRDEMIDTLWRRVAARLSHAWTLREMADLLGCSEEHLRRLCQRRYGCSPMRRLAALRMQHASSLLAETHLTIAAIGQTAGYENEFAFSNAFKRWSRGLPPSTYRRRATGAA